MNTRTRRHIIENISRNSADPQALDPRKPMPHIICKEARPHMERPASAVPPFMAGIIVGAVLILAGISFFS